MLCLPWTRGLSTRAGKIVSLRHKDWGLGLCKRIPWSLYEEDGDMLKAFLFCSTHWPTASLRHSWESPAWDRSKTQNNYVMYKYDWCQSGWKETQPLSHLAPHGLLLFHHNEADSHFKTLSSAKDSVFSPLCNSHSVHANPPTQVTSNLPWVVAMETAHDNVRGFQGHITRVCNVNTSESDEMDWSQYPTLTSYTTPGPEVLEISISHDSKERGSGVGQCEDFLWRSDNTN